MLCLSRNVDESVVIRHPDGSVMRITVIDAHLGRARLGFDAPAEVEINREEIDDQIRAGMPPLWGGNGASPRRAVKERLLEVGRAIDRAYAAGADDDAIDAAWEEAWLRKETARRAAGVREGG